MRRDDFVMLQKEPFPFGRSEARLNINAHMVGLNHVMLGAKPTTAQRPLQQQHDSFSF
jgi:hypothetical protein